MNKNLFTAILLFVTLATSLLLGKAQFKSVDVVGELKLPINIASWKGFIPPEDEQPKSDDLDFVSGIKQYYYWLPEQEAELTFLLINAGNFHNPRTCFTGSGYEPKEYPEIEIKVTDNFTVKTESYIMKKSENEGFLTTYWMIVNGKRVDWVEQKAKEFIFTLINKRRANLMVRIDVPLYKMDEHEIKHAEDITRLFVKDMYKVVDKHDRYYIFGE